MLQKLTRSVLLLTLLMPLLMGGAEARQASSLGQISGIASIPGTGTLANVKVQLRDLKTKQIVGTARTNADGRFVFVVLGPGDYVVEIVNEEDAVVGTTTPITLSPGAMVVSAVAVSPTAGGAAAALAGGAGSPASTTTTGDSTGAPPTLAGGTGTPLFGSSMGVVTSAATASGGASGTVPSRSTASPSR